MIKWFVFSSPCPWLLQLWWLFPVFSSPFWLIKMNKFFFSVTFAMSGSSGLLLVVHVLDSWDYFLAASVFHGSYTLSAPRSTYKFSWLASIYFLEKLLERICLQIKAFFFSDHSVNSLNLSTGLYIDFFRRKLIFVTLGTVNLYIFAGGFRQACICRGLYPRRLMTWSKYILHLLVFNIFIIKLQNIIMNGIQKGLIIGAW